ncbi:MAG: hypothetical protein V7K14_14550 [Nostoc sp.]
MEKRCLRRATPTLGTTEVKITPILMGTSTRQSISRPNPTIYRPIGRN